MRLSFRGTVTLLFLVAWPPAHAGPEAVHVEDSLVFVQVGYEEDHVFRPVMEGSGFLVNSEGWVVTAKHVADAELPEGKVRVYRGALRSSTADAHALFSVPGPVVSADVALLRFSPELRPSWPHLKVLANGSFVMGEAVAAYGYPAGQELSRRPGVVSSLMGPLGSVQVNVGLAPGMSGGPVVIDHTSCVVGVVAGGTGYPTFDFFTPIQSARPLLDQAPAEFVTDVARNASGSSAGQLIERSFKVDETKDDHGSTKSSRSYERKFDADKDSEITAGRFVPESVASASDQDLAISPDRVHATFSFRLESGPFYDQTRGWLHGAVVLTERTRLASPSNGC